MGQTSWSSTPKQLQFHSTTQQNFHVLCREVDSAVRNDRIYEMSICTPIQWLAKSRENMFLQETCLWDHSDSEDDGGKSSKPSTIQNSMIEISNYKSHNIQKSQRTPNWESSALTYPIYGCIKRGE